MGGASQSSSGRAADDLLRVYETALPEVYGYLFRRCGRRDAAEDLTAETFLAAADAVRRDMTSAVSVPWLIGVARHKLVDHWRRLDREQRSLAAVAGLPDAAADDPADEVLDALLAERVLGELAPQHRLVLTLRYVDDLPVADVAALLGRTVHATEALLVRAKRAFRVAYRACGEVPGE